MLLTKGQKFLMIGDSVTDFDRARPVGEGLFNALGTGYPMFFNASLQAAYPELMIRTVNMGVSGNNVRDLKARWQSDVLDLKPDWVSVLIGINDVWRQFDSPTMPETHVPLAEYKETLSGLVAQTLPHVTGMVLMTPYYMEPQREDPMRKRMDQYGAVVKEISEQYGTLFLDVQALFDHLFTYMHSANVAWDRVHPNAIGHMLIARGLLKLLGFDR